MATLLSLNAGMPKDVSWQGRTVHTGAWKAPYRAPAWCAGSTSTETAKEISPDTAAKCAPSSYTNCSPISTGRNNSAATT